ncbi:hypothetical protein JDV02_008125 [Purpureocillium takamizusanense]|uniref:MHYT domain-containing protein n=1 Tax=Purpureocillium takamizusanense TaxID=2060973 RepID=A0A9Q8QNX6_9HYPO|nr:uncharacterized protein JDV02_008125 [Purpureocillium takamizusanense]UNI22216.1 hypothetical protein JDV02_008125 [Purpureocillium takamizusanense]
MSSSEELLQQYADQLVPYDFNAGFVCLSYAISLIGTSTTLELIRRRTSHRGVHNLLLLVGAAISMGGIAIWSMHFIGNRAIYMLNGQESFQIAYSTSLTVLSLLVPILVLILAFLAVSGNGRIQWWRIGLAGLLSGGAICGMHYLADSSISNYTSSYKISYVVGSAIIAVSASATALAVFFVFETTWKGVWWKRLGCAMILAGAVSGMHWCAAVGTSYRLRELHSPGKGVSRHEAMIVVICLSVAAGVVMTASAAYSSWIRRDYASKSQQVVLAAAIFDSKGRIMVNQEGFLPTEVVTDTLVPKSNDDIFSTGHPLFHWMFRASRNWNTIAAVVAKMADHIGRLSPDGNMAGRAGVRLVGDDGLLIENYDIILRELFCLAATALASRTRETLTNVGVLWDEIFTTGDSSTLGSRPMTAQGVGSSQAVDQTSQAKDKSIFQSLAEKGLSPTHLQEYGRGCLMFLVRQVDQKRDAENLEAAGYRFAEVHQVVGGIRSSMQVKAQDLEARLRSMSTHNEKAAMLGPGVHLGMFAVRARLDRSGFDVLAQRDARNLLPTVGMHMDHLEPWQSRFLARHRGMTVLALAQRLETMEHASTQERLFASDLRHAISALRQSLDSRFDEATLLPREVQVPCFTCEEVPRPSTSTLIAFRIVLPIHATVESAQCEFTPLNFFKLRQLTYEGSPHHVEFSHMVHRDMSYVPQGDTARRQSTTTRGADKPKSSFSRAVDSVSHALPGRRRGGTHSSRLPSTRSQEELSRVTSHPSSVFHARDDSSFEDGHKLGSMSASSGVEELAELQQHSAKQMFGGIMVSQEIMVDVQENRPATHDNRTELNTVRSKAEGTAKVDKMYTATATGEKDARKGGEQRDFLDELLSMSMVVDKSRDAL